MPSLAYESKEGEFWYNVSPQDELPLAGQVDFDIDLKSVASFFLRLSKATDDTGARKIILDTLISDSLIFNYARQYLGVSDKRAYLSLSYIASRTPHPAQSTSLCGCQPWTLSRHPMAFFLRLLKGSKGKQVQIATAEMVAAYLIEQGLYQAAKGFSVLSDGLMELIYAGLIAPKEYQQRAAKRRGHGCEAALAAVLEYCGVDLLPINKSSNPMGASDPHLNIDTMTLSERLAGKTHAFDMIILSGKRVRIAIQSLIHTSDPGQYGVDKSNETVTIAEKIRGWNKPSTSESAVELWGLLDGVGFSENKSDTVNKLLGEFDHFIQLRTLYKAPLRLHLLGETTVRGVLFSEYYDEQDISAIKNLYVPQEVRVLTSADKIPSDWMPIQCGEAVVFL